MIQDDDNNEATGPETEAGENPVDTDGDRFDADGDEALYAAPEGERRRVLRGGAIVRRLIRLPFLVLGLPLRRVLMLPRSILRHRQTEHVEEDIPREVPGEAPEAFEESDAPEVSAESEDPPLRRTVSAPAMTGVVLALVVIGVLAWLALSGGDRVPGEGGDELELALVTPDDVTPEAVPEVDPDSPEMADEDVVIEAAPDLEEEAVATPPEPEPTAPTEFAEPSAAEDIAEPEPEARETRIALARPDPALMQLTTRGSLPIVSADGREPWQVYARPSDVPPGKPRLAIIIVGLGLSSAAVDGAIGLPGAVTLSFTPYAPMLEDVADRARSEGHEVLLDLPMEPVSYPADDPGPHTLLTSLNPTDNIARLEWLLGRFAGYVGVVTHMGSRFTTDPEALRPVLTALRDRGLMLVDSMSSSKSVATNVAGQLSLPHASNQIFVDHEPTRAAIDRTFADLEAAVLRDGEAIAVARSFPVTLERMAAWLPALEERGIVLVPASALAEAR